MVVMTVTMMVVMMMVVVTIIVVMMLVGHFAQVGRGLAARDGRRDGATRVQGNAIAVVIVALPGGNPGRLGQLSAQILERRDVIDVG